MRELATQLFSFALAQTMYTIQQVIQLGSSVTAAPAPLEPPLVETTLAPPVLPVAPPPRFEELQISASPAPPHSEGTGWGPMP